MEEQFVHRRTIRFYQQRPIADEILGEIIDAARLAPSAANLQRLRYIVVRTRDVVDRLLEMTRWGARVTPHRTPVAGKTGPAAFVIVLGPRQGNGGIQADAGAAIMSMLLSASNHGIGSCWLGSVDIPKAAELLNVPESMEILYGVALGYPAETPVLDDNAAEVPYYLDENDVLHVRKLSRATVSSWI